MFDSSDFFYIDFETTGLDPKSDRVCQIGAILPDGSELNTLINPDCDIPQESTECHGISNEMVKDAPLSKDVAEQLLKTLAQTKYFVAYNYVFDFQFLQYELYRATGHIIKESDYVFIDPYLIFKKAFPHTLANAYRFYFQENFEGNHTAINDIRATKDVLLAQAKNHPDFFENDLQKVEAKTVGARKNIIGKWFKTENDQIIFAQGKFKGKVVSKEHSNYLQWIYGLEDISLSELTFIKDLLKN